VVKKRKIVEVTISIKGKIGVGKVLNKKYYPPKMKPRNATDPTTGIKNKKLAGKQKPREKTQEGNSNYLGIQANNGGCPLCKVGINGMLEVGLGFEGGAFIYAEASVSQEWDPSKEFKFNPKLESKVSFGNNIGAELYAFVKGSTTWSFYID